MRTRLAMAGIAIVVLATACSGGSDPASAASDPAGSAPVQPASPAGANEVSPAIVPGGLGIGVVQIGDIEIDYVTIVPEGFEIGDTAPLMLAFPPGGQHMVLTERLAEDTYRQEAVARGWVVVSPAAPDGTLYYRGSERHVPGLLDWVETWMVPEGGLPHVVGVSNGGISAFRYAGNHPDRVASVLTFPGFPRSSGDVDALDGLAQVPIRLFVGENDLSWVPPMTDATARLEELGADVELQVFADEGHLISALSDGVQIFDTLDALRP